MYCYRATVQTDKGDALVGWQVECVQNDNLTTPVTIYADESSTPIASVSGVANRAVSDSAGNFYFFVADGLYGLRYYDSEGVYQKTDRYISMYGALSDSAGSSRINFIASGAGAVSRTVESKLRDVVSVKDFGAKGDGATNDTSAIQLADAYARSIGGSLHFPAGTYRASQLVLRTGSNWFGDGRESTIIKQTVGANTDLIYAYNSDANWGVADPTDFVVGFTLRDLTLDGSYTDGNTSGSGIAAFSPRPIIENVYIKNVAEHGMRTEYIDDAEGGIDTWAMEGFFKNIRIDYTGKHGWLNNGPHDSIDVGVIVIDASQSAAATYSGFYFGPRSNGRHVSCHAWTRSWNVRAKAAVEIATGADGNDFVGGCHFEGGYVANAIVSGSKVSFDDSTHFYAAWNGINVLLTGASCTLNTIRGRLSDPGPGRPACIGVKIGHASGDFVYGNQIEVMASAQEAHNIAFDANNTGGHNIVRGKCYNTTTATITGTPKETDDVDLIILNSSGKVRINTRHQVKTLSIGANSSVTWTFDYPFASAPVVTFSPDSPASALSSGIWISSRGATSVTFYNNNSVALTLDATAVAVA